MHEQVRPAGVAYGECWCGCGEKPRLAPHSSRARGWVKGEPIKFVHGHNNPENRLKPRPTPWYTEEDRGFTSPCWIWQGALNRQGYGVRMMKDRSQMAHRWMYEQRVGPVPRHLDIDHLCRVVRCVNPEHLEPVTHAENMRRGLVAKLTREQAEEIRGMPPKEAVAKFGISLGHAYCIRTGRAWVAE